MSDCNENELISSLLREIDAKNELISELKAEILELKVESSNDGLEPIEQAIEVINECKNEDGKIDYDKLSDKSNAYAEINQYLSVYLLFNDYEEESDGEM